MGIPPDETVLLFLGRMDRLKGIYPFLEAVAALRKRRRGFSALLVGSVELADIPERIRQLGVGDLVRLIGPVGKLDVLDYYCGSDVFVLPSYLEGISSSLIESMACGLPALATRVGGNTDIKVDVRVIAATNRDVAAATAAIEALNGHKLDGRDLTVNLAKERSR